MDYINQAGKKANQLAKKYIYILEIKPCELGSRIRDVEAFWYKTEIKIVYFVPLHTTVFEAKMWQRQNFIR